MEEAGEGTEIRIIEKIPEVIYISIVFLVVFLITAFYTINNLESKDIEMDVFYNRLMYSSNAISYHDNTIGRTYIGIIDINKLNSENIEKAIRYPDNRTIAAEINLYKANNEQITVFYQEEWYKNYAPLGKSGKKGIGGVDYFKKETQISYIEEDENGNKQIKKGLLRIEIVRPRS